MVCSGGYTEPNAGPISQVPYLLPINKTPFMWEEEFLHGGKKLGNLGRALAAWRSYSFPPPCNGLSKPVFSSVQNLKKFQGTIKTDYTLRERKNTRMHSTAFLLGLLMIRWTSIITNKRLGV